MITPQPVGISIIARRMPLCVLLNITEKQAERANATLNANPCQFGRDACFLLPVYQHVCTSHFPRRIIDMNKNTYPVYTYILCIGNRRWEQQPTTCLEQMRRKPWRWAYLISGFAHTCRCPRRVITYTNKLKLPACTLIFSRCPNSCHRIKQIGGGVWAERENTCLRLVWDPDAVHHGAHPRHHEFYADVLRSLKYRRNNRSCRVMTKLMAGTVKR